MLRNSSFQFYHLSFRAFQISGYILASLFIRNCVLDESLPRSKTLKMRYKKRCHHRSWPLSKDPWDLFSIKRNSDSDLLSSATSPFRIHVCWLLSLKTIVLKGHNDPLANENVLFVLPGLVWVMLSSNKDAALMLRRPLLFDFVFLTWIKAPNYNRF